MRLERVTEGQRSQRKEQRCSKKEHLCSFLLNEEAQHGLLCSAEESMW
jgi:hypothetical protein